MLFHASHSNPDLSPSTSILLAIFRSLLAKVAIMASVIYEFTSRSSCKGATCDNSCWENTLGREFYKLFVFDWLCSLVLNTFLFEVVAAICAKIIKAKV